LTPAEPATVPRRSGTTTTAWSRWIGSVVTDENDYTMAPFGAHDVFAKWID